MTSTSAAELGQPPAALWLLLCKRWCLGFAKGFGTCLNLHSNASALASVQSCFICQYFERHLEKRLTLFFLLEPWRAIGGWCKERVTISYWQCWEFLLFIQILPLFNSAVWVGNSNKVSKQMLCREKLFLCCWFSCPIAKFYCELIVSVISLAFWELLLARR